jgi:hypothetical protein
MMGQSGMKGFRMTLGVTTAIMVVMLAVGGAILVNGSLATDFSIKPSTDSVRDIAFLLTIPVLLAWLVAIGSKADRRCGEDFALQLVAAGALVGMITMFLFHAFWALDFLPEALGVRGMRGQDTMATGLIGWAAGYFVFRIRGLK